MTKTVRRVLAVTLGVGAILGAGAGVAFADDQADSGPADTYVLDGVPPVPLGSVPETVPAEVLAPAFNAIP